MTELEKQAKVGRQAINVRIMEILFGSVQTAGTSRQASEYTKMAIFNQETISEEEVQNIIKSGMYNTDPHIIMAWPDQIANVFPHRGDAENDNVTVYWKPGKDPSKCECSACGLAVPAAEAMECGQNGYTGVKYRFCPKCGSVMSCKFRQEENS